MEDLVYIHADRYIERIEREAEVNAPFRRALSSAYIGGMGGAAVERFLDLQHRIAPTE